MPPTRRSTRPAAAAAPFTRADRASSDSDSPAPVPKSRNVRSTRNPRTVIEPDSDDDEEMEDYDQTIQTEIDAEGSDDIEDEEMDDDDDDDDDDEEDDAEGEEDDADELPSHPPPPKIQTHTNSKGRPTVTVKAPTGESLKSVEAKEMEGADDEDLSDVDSDGIGHDIGLDDEEDDEREGGEGEDDEDNSDNSREGTPDLSKLTRRQRGQFEEFDGSLIALSNEAQKKKHISAEEHAMRRAEMARRRKNLSEKRNEEEKIDTINKLLKKPAPKRRTRAEILAAQAAGEGGTPGLEGEEGEEIKPDPVYVRWVSSSEGSRIGVPDEWLSAPIGRAYADSSTPTSSMSRGARVMVEEVS